MKLSFQHLDLHLTRSWVTARGRTDVSKVVVVELIDDDGVVGRGEAAPISRYKESVNTVEAFLQKIEPSQLSARAIPDSMAYLEHISRQDTAAKCAINIALWDILAKRSKQPLYDLLNLGFAENKHVTSFSVGLGTPEEVRSKVLAANDFPVLKMKAGGAHDRAALQALREAAPTKSIRVDANEAWQTKEEALRNIEWLANDRYLEFVEQPLPASTSMEEWIWLKQRSPLPVFGDESHHFAGDIKQSAQCFHGVNVKLVKTAGISGALESLTVARKAGLKTMLGCMVETSILISAAAQLATLCDYLDLDGNLLINNDPYSGVTATKGILSFANAAEKTGIQVSTRTKS